MRGSMVVCAALVATGCGTSALHGGEAADAVTYAQPSTPTVAGEIEAREAGPPSPRMRVERAPFVAGGGLEPAAAEDHLVVRLEDDVGPGVSRVGERFVARLTQPLADAAGRVIAPTGAVVLGHVSEVHDDSVTLAVDELSARGTTWPLAARVAAASTGRVVAQRSATVAGPLMRGGAGSRIATDGPLPRGTTLLLALDRPLSRPLP